MIYLFYQQHYYVFIASAIVAESALKKIQSTKNIKLCKKNYCHGCGIAECVRIIFLR